MSNIVSIGVSENDRKFIKNTSLMTLLNFFAAEVVGFGFGVPLAVILAIGYGNIADIFMDVYFIPVLVCTVVIVLFVAFPTNIFLTRKLIKVILDPIPQNIKEFSRDLPHIPVVAALNLFFRISIGGFIADIWGLLQHSNVSTEQFIALFSAPMYGAFSASVVYFFVLQIVLGNFNIKLKNYLKLGRSEVKRIKLLSFSDVYLFLIISTLVFAFLLLSLGEVLKAGFWGYFLISLSMLATISLVFGFSNKVLNTLFSNMGKVLSEWSSLNKTVVLSGLYDVENIIKDLEEYSQYFIQLDIYIENYSKSVDITTNLVNLSNRNLDNSLLSLKDNILGRNVDLPDYSSIKDSVGKFVSSLRTVSSQIDDLNISILKFSSLLSSFKEDNTILFDSFKFYTDRIKSISPDMLCYDTLKVIESKLNSLSEFAKNEVLKNLPAVEKLRKDMEILYINFQLEISRIGYLGEFRAVSSQVNKVLSELEAFVKDVNSSSLEFDKKVRWFYGEIRSNFVLFEGVISEFSKLNKNFEKMSEVLAKLQFLDSKIAEIGKGFSIILDADFKNVLKQAVELNMLISRLGLSKKLESEWRSSFYSTIKKAKDIIGKNVELYKSIEDIYIKMKV